MAWRWDNSIMEYAVSENELVHGIGWRMIRPPGDGWEPCERVPTFQDTRNNQFKDLSAHTHTIWERATKERGHCGAFGRPEP